MMATMSFSGVSLTQRTNEDAKERILCAMQIAVKEIQYYCTGNNIEDGLSANTREVLQLCDSLDKTLFHGLREYQKGYWPFVKDFTHSNIISYIEGLDHSPTEIQCGRAWLCLSLNENSLESYFRSFQQNPSIVQKHYSPPALLRDHQRMHLMLMHMSGLENVPVNLDLENTSCGSGLSFFSSYSYKGMDFMQSGFSNDFPMYEYHRPESESSFRDDDSGVIGCENAVDTTDGPNSALEESKTSSNDVVDSVPDISKNGHSSENEFERITKYLNMSPETEGVPSNDLEVVRTKVVRRFKKSPSHKPAEVKKGASCPENLSKTENADALCEHRLSKATTDSGLSLETHSSSDRDSPELTYENFNQKLFAFDIDVIHQDIAVKFSTPSRKPGESFVTEFLDFPGPLEERGAPEGQETAVENPCLQSTSSRLPLLSGNDGLDDEDEEISIYDIAKNSNFVPNSTEIKMHEDFKDVEDIDDVKTIGDDVRSEISSSLCSTIHATPDHCINPTTKSAYKDPVDEELKEILMDGVRDMLDIRLDNSTLLYLLVEVFEHEEEEYYKMFQCYLRFPMGNDQISLILLTNKCMYILEPGNCDQKFVLQDSMKYSNIDTVTVQLNYQGFTVMSKNFKQILKFYTADEFLTRSIISNLDVAIRRAVPKHILPSVFTNGSLQIRHLKKIMASQLRCKREDILIHHFVLAWWEDFKGSNFPETPAGPRLEGSLMYRHRFSGDVVTLWQPGFFVLNGSVLYCMEEEAHIEPLFFIQMWVPHCKGCRRLHAPVRPYAFEIILANGDSLQLAAADELEACKWQQAFLQTVSLAGHLIDCNGDIPTSGSLVIFNDHISVIEEMTDKTLVKCIGLAEIRNLVTVCTSSIPTCLYMEFEIAEADKSCGEWIILFDSEHEKEKFLDVLKWRWSSLFQTNLKISSIKDLSLATKIQQSAHNKETDKTRIQDYCYES